MPVTDAEVVGLTSDRKRVVLRTGDQTFEALLADVHRVEREILPVAAPPGPAEPLTPRLIQQRIRAGESAAQVASDGGWTVDAVQRYDGPVLAEREHHARSARRSEVEDRTVESLVAHHLGVEPEDVEWDSWLVAPGQWQVRASAGVRSVVLRWEPAGRAVKAVDEPGRQALRQVRPDDDLTAVLRPLSARQAPSGPPAAARPARRSRAQVPLWDDISRQVTGLGPDDPRPAR